jgi:hypothetical protein
MYINIGIINIGVILVLILLAILVYIKPLYFRYLFKTILGNLLLCIIIGVIFSVNWMWGIGLASIAFMIFIAFNMDTYINKNKNKNKIEGFGTADIEDEPKYTATLWSQQLIDDFINFEKIHNPNLRFDINIIQTQATPSEVNILLDTGKWPWSIDIQNMYKQSISQNNIVNVDTETSLNKAQTIYNQTAIIELLSWNSKEGSFLLNGVVIGHSKDVPANINNVIKCGENGQMEKVEYSESGSNIINTVIANIDLPKLINGFTFLKEECNPCSALQNSYNCPFSLNTGNGDNVSSVWSYLWKLDNKFPLLEDVDGEIKTSILTDDMIQKKIYYGTKNMN